MTWLELRLKVLDRYGSTKNIGFSSSEVRAINALFRYTRWNKNTYIGGMTALELHEWLGIADPNPIPNLGRIGATAAQSALLKMLDLFGDGVDGEIVAEIERLQRRIDELKQMLREQGQ